MGDLNDIVQTPEHIVSHHNAPYIVVPSLILGINPSKDPKV